MKNYIFNREKDDFMRDIDGEKIYFASQNEVWDFLKFYSYKDEFIKSNFCIMKGVKILEPEEIELITPTPPQDAEGMAEEKAKAIDKILNEANGSWKDIAEESYDIGFAAALTAAGVVKGEDGERKFTYKEIHSIINPLKLGLNYDAGYHWGAGIMKDMIFEKLKAKDNNSISKQG